MGGNIRVASDLSNDSKIIIDCVTDISDEIQDCLLRKPITSPDPSRGAGLGLWLNRLMLQSIGGDTKIGNSNKNGPTMLVTIPTSRIRKEVSRMTAFTPEHQFLDLSLLIQDNLNRKEQLRISNETILQTKINNSNFDVFLCYNNEDKVDVKAISKQLKQQGIYPWLDEDQLRPGVPWQRELEKQVEKIKSVAIFIGKCGMGPWQTIEIEAFLREFIKRGCSVIPVILPITTDDPDIPAFLNGNTWVDFRKLDPDPLKQLIWGITGEKY